MALSNEEYRDWMDMVSNACRLLSLVPIQVMLDDLGLVEAVAPVLEPTAYIRGGYSNLDHQRRILTAARALQKVAEDIVAEASP